MIITKMVETNKLIDNRVGRIILMKNTLLLALFALGFILLR